MGERESCKNLVRIFVLHTTHMGEILNSEMENKGGDAGGEKGNRPAACSRGESTFVHSACFAEVFSARGGCGSGSGVPSRVTHKRCLQRPAVLRCATGCLRESSCERSNHPTNSLEPVRPDSGVGGPPPHDRQATPTEPHSSRLTQSNPTGWNRPPPTAGIHDMTYLDQTPFYAHKNTNDRRRARTHAPPSFSPSAPSLAPPAPAQSRCPHPGS